MVLLFLVPFYLIGVRARVRAMVRVRIRVRVRARLVSSSLI